MKKWAILFLALSLIICCLAFNFLISKHYLHKDLEPDESLYNSMALSLLEGRSTFQYGVENIDIGMEVTPIYPAFVSGAYLINTSKWSPLILNILLSCITLVLLLIIIKDITGSLILAFFSALGFTFYFPLWAYNFFIMMEITTVTLLTIVVFLFVKYFKENRTVFLYSAMTIFSILVLLNNRFIALLSVFILLLLYQTIFSKVLHFRKLIISFLITILIIGPWFVRQFVVYDQFVFFTPKWNNLVSEKIGIFKPVNFTSIEDMSDSYKLQDYNYYLERIDRGKSKFSGIGNQFTQEKFQEAISKRDRIKNIYLARLVRYFTLFDNDFRFLYPDSYRIAVPSSLPYKLIQATILLPLFVFSFLGFIISIVRKETIIIYLSLLWFSHIFLHILIHYIDRYRLTILPVLLIISAYGFSEGIKYFKTTLKRSLKYLKYKVGDYPFCSCVC